MRRAAPFLPLPGLAVLTDCARSIWSPIPISIPAKGHIGGRSELNGGLRVITSVAAIDPSSNESPEWALCWCLLRGDARTACPACRVQDHVRKPQSADHHKWQKWEMREREGTAKEGQHVRSSAVPSCFASMEPPPEGKPTFPTSRTLAVGGGGVAETQKSDIGYS